mmetsp:Transcript_28847/g.42574  ORF Transcript_28847/g.42574 Transcript_28847/m.42574 type:complete len:222 (+) Transcript_28847:116-781(+)|eukprot:CAMPEP_0194212080 /NCGR_PEP_ID=MMETSP0156-20130528/11707_1 /TAXON_ID=33649 /ORGANISM="Thalassionema nitzschioides, Strain L26-B" /LENGTH=221 /DNA_ID=CAMNT_0038939815 /DNA_START=45 /DNA_END=710 /DNA_ORIENTATION=-
MYCELEDSLLPLLDSCFEDEEDFLIDDTTISSLELRSYDVVVCNGSVGKFDHVGNRRLAVTLSIHCGTYMAARLISERKFIAGAVVDIVTTSYRPGGRFLKMDHKKNQLVAVDRDQATQWVYKAFQRLVAPKVSPGNQKWLDYYEGARESSPALSTSVASEILPAQSSLAISIIFDVPNYRSATTYIADEEAIDAQLADLLLKQNRIFVSLSEKADAVEET